MQVDRSMAYMEPLLTISLFVQGADELPGACQNSQPHPLWLCREKWEWLVTLQPTPPILQVFPFRDVNKPKTRRGGLWLVSTSLVPSVFPQEGRASREALTVSQGKQMFIMEWGALLCRHQHHHYHQSTLKRCYQMAFGFLLIR